MKNAIELTRIALGKSELGFSSKIEAIKQLRIDGVLSTCQTVGGAHICTGTNSPGTLGLKDAKDLIESWMDRVESGPGVEKFLNLTGPYKSEPVTQVVQLANDLHAEKNAARVTEQRLGKALSQVAGLKEKLQDRNERLKDLADAKRTLEARVRDLEALIADNALAESTRNRFGFYNG